MWINEDFFPFLLLGVNYHGGGNSSYLLDGFIKLGSTLVCFYEGPPGGLAEDLCPPRTFRESRMGPGKHHRRGSTSQSGGNGRVQVFAKTSPEIMVSFNGTPGSTPNAPIPKKIFYCFYWLLALPVLLALLLVLLYGFLGC